MNSKELNKKLEELDRFHPELNPEPLKVFSLAVPYHSFLWKEVNFDKAIWLGVHPYRTIDEVVIKPWVGFCPGNKYGYTRWQATVEESAKIRELCELLVEAPSVEKTTILYDYLQTLTQRPKID